MQHIGYFHISAHTLSMRDAKAPNVPANSTPVPDGLIFEIRDVPD
jgi:hypothetical protein